jgi:hypothetical protein
MAPGRIWKCIWAVSVEQSELGCAPQHDVSPESDLAMVCGNRQLLSHVTTSVPVFLRFGI